jgi:hypothetical protein
MLLAVFGPNHVHFLRTCPGQWVLHPRTMLWITATLMFRPAILQAACGSRNMCQRKEKLGLNKHFRIPGCRTLQLILHSSKHFYFAFHFTLASRDVFFRLFCGTPFFR